MNIQYQIFELDRNHLKEKEAFFNKQDRICFLEAKLDGWGSQYYDTFDECVKMLEKYGNNYTEYTIIPRIYITTG